MEPLLKSPEKETAKGSLIRPSLDTKDPITLYNYFINIYNKPINKISNLELKQMSESLLFKFFHKVLSNLWGKMLVLLLLLGAPFLNLIIYFLTLLAVIHYEMCLSVFKKNSEMIPHPFTNMVYHPELCEIYQRNHYEFEMQITELKGLSFNHDIINNLEKRNSNGEVQFTIYDDNLWKCYYDFPNYRLHYTTWMVLSTIFFAVDVVACFLIYDKYIK